MIARALQRTWRGIDDAVGRAAVIADETVSRIPRGFWEAALLVAFALVVSALALKNLVFAFAAVTVLVAATLLLRSPILVVYATVGMLPLSWVNLLGERLRVVTFMTLVAFGFYFSQLVLRRERPSVEPLYKWIAAYVAICFLSILNSVDPAYSITGMKYYLFALVFALALIMSMNTRRHLVVFATIILAWGVVQSLLAMAQSIGSPWFFPAYHFNVHSMDIVSSYAIGAIRRASGTFESGPRLAMFLLLPTAISLTFFFRNIDGRKVLWGSVLVVLAMGLFFSFTRIAVVLAGGFLFLYYFFEPEKARLWRTTFTVLTLSAIILILFTFFFPADVYDAMEARFTQEGDQIYLDRFYFLYNALMAFTEHPLLGYGFKTYTIHSWDFMQRFPVPWRSLAWEVSSLSMPQSVPVHNDYGRMLAETGIFSLAAFVGTYVIAFRNLREVVRRAKDPVIEAMGIAFTLFLAVMIVYWFFHEYIMEEPYVAILPFAFSIILRRMAQAESSDASPG